jgi:hypothetical protein
LFKRCLGIIEDGKDFPYTVIEMGSCDVEVVKKACAYELGPSWKDKPD